MSMGLVSKVMNVLNLTVIKRLLVIYHTAVFHLYRPIRREYVHVTCMENLSVQIFQVYFMNWHKVYRGELFNISVAVVGYDFGVTVGTGNAGFVSSQKQGKSALHPDQYRQFL